MPLTDPARGATAMRDVLIRGGVREPSGYPRSIRVNVKGCIQGIFTDNAVTPADLTQDWTDINVLRAAGRTVDTVGTTALTPVDNPAAVLVIEKAALFIDPAGAEDPHVIAPFWQYACLAHQPSGGDPREVPAAEIMGDAYQNRMVAAGPLYQGSYQDVVCKPLRRGPFWTNLERDVLVLKPLVAINTGANVPFFLFFEGHAFANDGWVSGDAGSQCNDDAASLVDAVKNGARKARAVIQRFAFGGIPLVGGKG